MSGVASMQGFHGGTGRVCALLLTFLSASNDRSSGHNETINWARGLDIFLSCDKNAATNPSTPGWAATLPLPDYGRVARNSGETAFLLSQV
jgi:hypothetical protein